MPFTLIKGTFHLQGQTKTGRPSGFEPDGDSMQFKPADPKLLDRLSVIASPVRLTSIGSTQLRFEGIDALEIHYEGSHQPRPLADQARDHLTGDLGMNPVPYSPPAKVRVKPPAGRDAIPGYIAARSLEVNGRPVAFAFEGTTSARDGSDVFLDGEMLTRSLNYSAIAAGHAYPLFYDTLFADLREVLSVATARARQEGLGVWAKDKTQTGVGLTDQAYLERNAVVFPKLYRRLVEYLKQGGVGAKDFIPWLAASREQILDLTTKSFTHFDNVIHASPTRVRFTKLPEQIVFVSAKTSMTSVAPWVKL